MRLLIIDDNRLDRRRIKRLFAQTGMAASIAEAEDFPSALAMVAVERFDCILVDYHLPGADGIELARQIAANHDGLTTPMVMLTGEPSHALAEAAIGAGLADFLGKRSLSAEVLRQVITNVILKHHAEGSGARKSADADGRETLVVQALTLLEASATVRQALEKGEDDALMVALDLLRRAAAADGAPEPGQNPPRPAESARLLS